MGILNRLGKAIYRGSDAAISPLASRLGPHITGGAEAAAPYIKRGAAATTRPTMKVGDAIGSRAVRAADRSVEAGSPGVTGRFGKPLVAGAVGVTLASSNLLSGDENTYGMQQALFEGVLGNPYADVAITGGHVDMFRAAVLPDLIPGHSELLETHRTIKSFNRTSLSNMVASQKADKWRMGYDEREGVFQAFNAGSRLTDTINAAIEDNYGGPSGYNYRPINSTLGDYTYRPSASNQAHDPRMGDIVFGAYNLRHG